jgi:Fe-S oxidoreductase
MCPPYSHRTITISDQEIQEQVKGYVAGGTPTGAVVERSRLCNECYKCVPNTCPQGLDPMRTNQLMRGFLDRDSTDPRPFTPPSDEASDELVTAALLTTEDEFRRINTPAVKGKGSTLFFSGCNVYEQPHLLLTAMDILDHLEEDWTFLPGLSKCCGSNYDSAGRLENGEAAFYGLKEALEGSGAELVVIWCPTCEVRFARAGIEVPMVHFSRYLASQLEDKQLPAKDVPPVAIHEPCKTAYLGMDSSAIREVLEVVTGEPVREMARCGEDTTCCEWALDKWQKETAREARNLRRTEARTAGADILVTVCHGCQGLLDRPGETGDVGVESYVTLVGNALGIRHEGRHRRLREINDVEKAMDVIRKAMGERFDQLPFSQERIAEAVSSLLGKF